MRNLREKKGITLVALIVTIIILLILAGVTIALLNGENGILSRAEKAATSYETESIKEVVNLKLANLNASKWIDEGRKAVLKDLNELDDENSNNFDTEIMLKNQVVDADTNAILIYENHEIEIDSNFNIAKVDGVENMGTTGGTSGGSNNGESGSTGGGNVGVIDSEEYAQMQATIAQLNQKIQTLTTNLETANQKIDTLEENSKNYATIEYANSLPQNSGNYTDLNWTLLGTTQSQSGVSLSNVNIDDYNYICIAVKANAGIVNPFIMSVKQFKSMCTDSNHVLYSQFDGTGHVSAWYSGGLVWARTQNSGNPCMVYGLK